MGFFLLKNVLSKLLGHYFTPLLPLQLHWGKIKLLPRFRSFVNNQPRLVLVFLVAGELRPEAPSVCCTIGVCWVTF